LIASAQSNQKLLFGIGPEAIDAINFPIVQQSSIKMLTSWYNGKDDLKWMSEVMKNKTVPSAYAKGYVLHLIVYAGGSEGTVNTKFGEACGRAYPVSDEFQTNMKELANIFKGNGTLYVTFFTEFQGYTCKDNQWAGNENYFNALKSSYRQASGTFKQINPKANVSIGWGGWQGRFDDSKNGGGRSLIPYFKDIMQESDFVSFQSMQSDHNTQDVKTMTSLLRPYGPVMLAHYKPDNKSQQTFDNDIKAFFTDEYINDITKRGLFAISFMDHSNLSNSSASFELVKNAVNKYGGSTTIPTKKIATATPKPTATPTLAPTTVPSPTATTVPTPEATPYVKLIPAKEPSNIFSKIWQWVNSLFRK
jgi:hypothetical protein